MRGRYLCTKRDPCLSEGFPLSEDLRALGQNAPNRRPKIQPEKKAGKPSRRFADGGRAFARESEQDPRIGSFSSKEKGASASPHPRPEQHEVDQLLLGVNRGFRVHGSHVAANGSVGHEQLLRDHEWMGGGE